MISELVLPTIVGCVITSILNHFWVVRPLKSDLKLKDEEIQKQQVVIVSRPNIFDDALKPWIKKNKELNETANSWKSALTIVESERDAYKTIALTHEQESFEKALQKAKNEQKIIKRKDKTVIWDGQKYRASVSENFKRIKRDAELAVKLAPGEQVTVAILSVRAMGWWKSTRGSFIGKEDEFYTWDKGTKAWKIVSARATSLNSVAEAIDDCNLQFHAMKAGIKTCGKEEGDFLFVTDGVYDSLSDPIEFTVELLHWKPANEAMSDIQVKIVEVLKTETKVIEIEKVELEPTLEERQMSVANARLAGDDKNVDVHSKTSEIDYEKLAAALEVRETNGGHKNLEIRARSLENK